MKYDSLEKFIDGEKNKFNYFNEYIKETISLYIKIKNTIIQDDDSSLSNIKWKNIKALLAYNLFLVNELLTNIILKNHITMFSLTRIIIENIYTLCYLNSSSETINEIYFDYYDLQIMNVWGEEKIAKYQEKYNVKINKNKTKQWIEQINNKSKYIGFRFIKEEVEKLNIKQLNYMYDWYKQNSSFIHTDIGSSKLNISLVLDENEDYIKFEYFTLVFIVEELEILIKIVGNYIKINKEEMSEIKRSIEEFNEKIKGVI